MKRLPSPISPNIVPLPLSINAFARAAWKVIVVPRLSIGILGAIEQGLP
jgi:hypothetical protein